MIINSVRLPIHQKLQRKIRKALRLVSENALNTRLAQNLLGFLKNGSTVVDTLRDSSIEYNYKSVIGNALFFSGYFEDWEIDFCADKIVNSNASVVFDIGANVGLHSIRWSKALKEIKVFAFEPSPQTRDVLERNIRRNSLENKVMIVPKAVSDKVGYAKFFCCNDDAFSSLKNTQREEVVHSVEVPVTTIDEFVKAHSIDKISLIKIDVEGLETEVISGAINTLTTAKPDLFIEIYGGVHSNLAPERTIHLICSFGYQAFVLRDGSAVPFIQHSDSYYNYYFTCKSVTTHTHER